MFRSLVTSFHRTLVIVAFIALGSCSSDPRQKRCGSPALSKKEVVRALVSELKARGSIDPLVNTRVTVRQDGCNYTVFLVQLRGPYGAHLVAKVARSGKVLEVIHGH